jgi:hypothetical protein
MELREHVTPRSLSQMTITAAQSSLDGHTWSSTGTWSAVDMAWIVNQRDAVGQAHADTQAMLSGGVFLQDPVALSVRPGDLTRSNSLLSPEASLKRA